MIKFPKHHQLYIVHNEHHTHHESVQEYLDRDDRIEISEEDRQECIRVNEIWEIQWYEISNISFYCVGAPTFEKCLEIINTVGKYESK